MTLLPPEIPDEDLGFLDMHFARFIGRITRTDDPSVPLAAALVSRDRVRGHVCLDLAVVAGSAAPKPFGSVCPELRDWQGRLLASGAAGLPGEERPLILDGSKLYLHRYWQYQKRLADRIGRMASTPEDPSDTARAAGCLHRLFPETEGFDRQKLAAAVALLHRFCVITGGPGTGKTFTVAKILSLLRVAHPEKALRIALAAPTGKAAHRLQESVTKARETTDLSIPALQASTLHRLLKPIAHTPYFRYNEFNPLSVDVMVVDEASMVDLALMSKLVQALPGTARLILLGDKNQLASVEAGAVLGDICDTGTDHGYSRGFCDRLRTMFGISVTGGLPDGRASGIEDTIVELEKSYRFGEDSGIREISRAVNRGDDRTAAAVLTGGNRTDIRWRDLPEPRRMAGSLHSAVIPGYSAYLARLDDPEAVFRAFDEFRILCALRNGPYGSENVNRLTESILAGTGLIRPDRAWYPGRPVMIRVNDYRRRLFNGDVGIALNDPSSGGKLRVFFPNPEGGFRSFSPAMLPVHETVFAMTIHKSQGSEFNTVIMMLPDRETPLLTRELLYTGMTRAVSRIEIWTPLRLFRQAVTRKIQRTSGLGAALWGGDPS